MKLPQIIEFVEDANWTRIWATVGTISTFWIGLTALSVMYPAFDTAYKIINIVLGAGVNAALYAARAGKYVADKSDPPQDGRP